MGVNPMMGILGRREETQRYTQEKPCEDGDGASAIQGGLRVSSRHHEPGERLEQSRLESPGGKNPDNPSTSDFWPPEPVEAECLILSPSLMIICYSQPRRLIQVPVKGELLKP